MNRYQQILTVAVVILAVANIILLGFLWKNRPERAHFEQNPGRDLIAERFRNDMEFNADQFEEFRTLQKDHRRKVLQFTDKMRDLNHELHRSIIRNQQSNEQAISKQIDSLHFLMKDENTAHIRDLAAICNDEQKEMLLQVLKELPDRNGHRGRSRAHHRNPDRQD